MPSGGTPRRDAKTRHRGKQGAARGKSADGCGSARVHKFSQYCRAVKSQQTLLAARFSGCSGVLGRVVLHAPAKEKPLKAKDFFILGLHKFCEYCRLAPGSCGQRLRAWFLSTTTNNTTMRQTLFLTVLAAALLGSGVANAKGTLKASDYKGGGISLAPFSNDKLVVDTPLTLTGNTATLSLFQNATIEFQKKQAADEICSIFTTEQLRMASDSPVSFKDAASYNFTFDDGAQAIVAASAGKTITLIHDITKDSVGFGFVDSPSDTTLTLNGKGYNETVELDGVSFTYVGPQEDTYTFKEGEIGFTGYYKGSHALNLVVGGGSVPEPTTGTLSLLALAGLCARRRRK